MAFTIFRMGDEIRVNAYGREYQGDPSVTALSNGRWVVTWDGDGPNGRGIYQQVYNADGTPVFPAERFIGPVTTGGSSPSPHVEAVGSGWVVTWSPGVNSDILLQRFDADGNPFYTNNGQAAPLTVNQGVIGVQAGAKITVLSDGWLVVWQDHYRKGVYCQRYDMAGNPVYLNGASQPEEKRVNAALHAEIIGQDVAAIGGGATAVVWSHAANSSSPTEIVLQILDGGGNRIYDRVIATVAPNPIVPRIEALPDGGFLVVWTDADADRTGVFLQRFTAQGAANGGIVQVNTIEAGQQGGASVEVLDDGGWIVTFSRHDGPQVGDVFQRRYDSDGNPQGPEFPIAAWLGSQWNRQAEVSSLGNGKWVVAWSNWRQGGDQESGVAQRVFMLSDTTVLTGEGEVAIGTADPEALQVLAGGLSVGDRILGGGGDDTLEMMEAGALDLTAPLEFSGIEVIKGSTGADTLIANAARLSGVTNLDGGADHDELQIAGGGIFDFDNIELQGIERITLTGPATTVTVYDVATALLIHGDGSNDGVAISGQTLSKEQRYQLFRQGLETVQDGDGVTYVKGLGEILNLNGDQVFARVGSTVPLDDNLDAEIDMTPPHYAWLKVKVDGPVKSQDRLLVSNTATVTVESGGIMVDGAWIGVIAEDGSGSGGLVIRLLAAATPPRVQELVRALSFQHVATDTPVTGKRPVSILLEDAGGSTTFVSVDVFVLGAADNAPPSVQNRNPSPATGADTALLSPFANVRVSDDNNEVTVVITFDPTRGDLVLGPKNFGDYDAASGRYTVTAHPDDVTDDLRTLQFDPRDRTDPVGKVERTAFTISVSDGVASDSIVVNVDAATANRAPAKPAFSGSSTVKELTKDGTEVGTVSSSDPNGGDTLRYSLVGAEDAPFRLETANGVTRLVVTNGVRLDHEQKASYIFTLRATDAGGLSNDTVVTIAVSDISPERTAGSVADDVIKGGAGKDTLGGGLGKDTLWGGLGNDVLTGGKGKDIFVFATKTSKSRNVDRIGDFSAKDDSIWLDNGIFTKIGKGTEAKPGKLKKDMFWIGKAAHDASDRIIYDKATGALYYDMDGTGRAVQVRIATLKKGLALTEKDFFII